MSGWHFGKLLKKVDTQIQKYKKRYFYIHNIQLNNLNEGKAWVQFRKVDEFVRKD